MSAYSDKMWERHKAQQELDASKQALSREQMDGKIIDESGPTPESAGAEEVQKARSAAESGGGSFNAGAFSAGANSASQAAESGNQLGTAGGTLMAAGAIPSPASPYLMAAGLGLQVVGAGEQNKRNQEEAQRQAYNDRIAKRQEAMMKIASMGIQ